MNKKIFLWINGLVMIFLGLLDFMIFGWALLFAKLKFTSLQMTLAIIATMISLLFIYLGIMLIRLQKKAAIVTATISGLSLATSILILIVSFLSQRIQSLIWVFPIIFYTIMIIFLWLGWEELK